jgi:hypothetical protein
LKEQAINQSKFIARKRVSGDAVSNFKLSGILSIIGNRIADRLLFRTGSLQRLSGRSFQKMSPKEMAFPHQ